MKRLASLLLGAVLGASALAQVNVFRSTQEVTNSFGPAGPTGLWFGQPPATQWVSWPERGAQVVIGAPATLTEITIYFLAEVQQPLGTESVIVTLYDNTGPNAPGSNGGSFPAPNNVLWQSQPILISPGVRALRVPIPGGVNVPSTFTFTARFTGGRLSQPPFDPGERADFNRGAGLYFYATPQIGSLPDGGNGLVWRRVFTANGPSDWVAQQKPATWSVPFSFGFSAYAGTPTVPFDNQTEANQVVSYFGLPATRQAGGNYTAAGMRVNAEGTSLTLTSATINYYCDTANVTGNPTFTLELWDVDRTTGTDANANVGRPVGTPLWVSPPQPIPLGQGGGGQGALQTVTIPIPNVTVPNEFAWVFRVNGIPAGVGNAGPAIRWAPKPGNQINGFYLFSPDANLFEGTFIFGPAPPTGQVFQTVANFDIKFNGTTGPVIIRPESVTRQFGLPGNPPGNLASLFEVDQDYFRSRPGFVPNAFLFKIQNIIEATSPFSNLSSLALRVNAAANSTGIVEVIEFFNFQTNQFEQVGTDRNVALVDQSRDLAATGNLARFLGPNNLIRARFRYNNLGLLLLSNWEVRNDQAVWIATGGSLGPGDAPSAPRLASPVPVPPVQARPVID